MIFKAVPTDDNEHEETGRQGDIGLVLTLGHT